MFILPIVEEVKVEAPGIQQWREAVKSSKTMSRLHVLLGILENCVKWEKSAANAVSILNTYFKGKLCYLYHRLTLEDFAISCIIY
jgi:hypothetical protein